MTATTSTQLAAPAVQEPPEAGEVDHMLAYATRLETHLFECISCETTNLTRMVDLAKDGWAEYEIPSGEVIVLCDGCKATYAERRRIREALSWGLTDGS